ncbi:carboxylesterase [Oceanobacillus sp. J11TS1]|uniref:alpha/beta hydrolase n=1 Tax=Oceanobacillus sp. J11TS1 TaxID=2807191 RepID=UPI001B0C9AD2|nr:alpha/beta fold hydrolase [Oceanobacillus sp. J11TS1]GIO23567.1 carboxylesterase [Oceanobacillus sp. J11TS1]
MNEQYPVLKGAEPFQFEGNRVGVLVSHGFTGTTQSMYPIGKAFADAGYTVYGPRLKGHGTAPEDMEKCTYQDWVDSIEEAYSWLEERCDTIFMCGLSMGGTLTLHTAAKHSLAGIILINAAVEISAMDENQEARFIDAIGSDIKKEGAVELAYDKTPVKSIGEIKKLMKETKANLAKITCPALIFVSNEDHVVPPDNSQTILEGISSAQKEIISLKESYHVATLDNDQDLIIEKSLSALQSWK